MFTMNIELLSLVESVLGSGDKKSRDNYAFYCPSCKHHNKKLEIDMYTNTHLQNKWGCWVCGFRGRTIRTLFKVLRVSKDKMDKLNSLIKYKADGDEYKDEKIVYPRSFNFIKDYNNLKGYDRLFAKTSIKYLEKRNVLFDDIVKYNIGISTDGYFKNRIIFPSYDSDGILNYYTGRNIIEDGMPSYLFPESSKNIIPYESHINFSEPVVLCEGVFDAIAIRNNAIPLLGKFVSENLHDSLVTKSNDIYICMDRDAMKEALKLGLEYKSYGKNVYIVELPEKDPSEMGWEEVNKLIRKTPILSDRKILEMKFNYNI